MYTTQFQAYKEAVVAAFLIKKDQTQMDWLNRPTRARLKRELKQRAEDGLNTGDEETLRQWLQMKTGNNDFVKAIDEYPDNYFRGLGEFMLNTGSSPRERSVEMLALLIEFNPRPFKIFKGAVDHVEQNPARSNKVIADEIATTAPERPGVCDAPEVTDTEDLLDKPEKTSTVNAGQHSVLPPGHPQTLPQHEGYRKFKWLIIAVGAILIGVVIWFLTRSKCMYWNNDRYVSAYCDIPLLDTPLVSLNQAKIHGFRRIVRVDTLSDYALTHFWYARIGGQYEVFTGSGNHPLYPDKQLQRVTDYVIIMCKKQGYGKP